jgi:hypothetical protein
VSEALDPDRCPLCGNGNDCGMARGAETCWCFEAVIPDELIEKVPAEARGVVCVCKACASGAVAASRSSDAKNDPSRER